MKCFATGSLGAILIIVLGEFLSTQYSDYRGVSETEEIILQIKPIKQAIEATAIKQKSFVDIDKNTQIPKLQFHAHIDFIDVTNTGAIIVKGGRDGQILILSPSFIEEKIVWHCTGGPTWDMPSAHFWAQINCEYAGSSRFRDE